MNRQQRRRAQAAGVAVPPQVKSLDLGKAMATLGSLQEFAGVVEKLKPLFAAVDHLSARLDEASEALADAQRENSELRSQLERQRQVFLRLCAQGMGITVEEVLSMEAVILEQLPTVENRSDADSSTEPERAADQASHPSS
jgi:DNA repair ATPase RecN